MVAARRWPTAEPSVAQVNSARQVETAGTRRRRKVVQFSPTARGCQRTRRRGIAPMGAAADGIHGSPADPQPNPSTRRGVAGLLAGSPPPPTAFRPGPLSRPATALEGGAHRRSPPRVWADSAIAKTTLPRRGGYPEGLTRRAQATACLRAGPSAAPRWRRTGRVCAQSGPSCPPRAGGGVPPRRES